MSPRRPFDAPVSTASRRAFVATLATALVSLAACASLVTSGVSGPPYANAHAADGDDGTRAPAWYFLRRAWVQLTRDAATTPLPRTVPLDLDAMAAREFAVAWLGHSSLLVRTGGRWILLDPVFSNVIGPTPPLGPKRLTPLPFRPDALPRIDVVLISHDHFDHLDLPTLRGLAAQPGGPPRFVAGSGLAAWLSAELGVAAEELGWWQATRDGPLALTFVPAHHSSGRSLWTKNRTLWGGWVLDDGRRRFFYAGDTAYSAPLFRDIRDRVGAIDLAALPIGAYRPSRWMRFEHVDPPEAVQAHLDLGARRSIGVHWATFQLGDEEPIQPADDLRAAAAAAGASFEVLDVGQWVEVEAAPRR